MYSDEYNGEILYNDIDIKKLNMVKLRQKRVSLLEQSPYLIEGSSKDNIHLTEEHCDNKYYSRMIKKEIGTISNNGEGISGGERQKIGILRALSKQSDLLVFDEPTSALDQESKTVFFEILTEIKKEKIIIFISHDKEIDDIADYVIHMSVI